MSFLKNIIAKEMAIFETVLSNGKKTHKINIYIFYK